MKIKLKKESGGGGDIVSNTCYSRAGLGGTQEGQESSSATQQV